MEGSIGKSLKNHIKSYIGHFILTCVSINLTGGYTGNLSVCYGTEGPFSSMTCFFSIFSMQISWDVMGRFHGGVQLLIT